MDQGSRDEVARSDRRERMRDSARGLQNAGPSSYAGFETPAWLEKSFVLPLTKPEVTDVPSQPVPHHDDFEDSTPRFVRPPAPEIDFTKVVRRSTLARAAFRSAIVSTGLAGLSVIGFLLTSWAVVLGMGIAFGVVALVAFGLRVRLSTAPIPYLDR